MKKDIVTHYHFIYCFVFLFAKTLYLSLFTCLLHAQKFDENVNDYVLQAGQSTEPESLISIGLVAGPEGQVSTKTAGLDIQIHHRNDRI